jgi:hypothetical protein
VLRIRDVYPRSEIFSPRIPDPYFSIPDPGTAKIVSKLSEIDPGCSSRIRIPDPEFYPSRIPDPRVKKKPDPGSESATMKLLFIFSNTVLDRRNMTIVTDDTSRIFLRGGNGKTIIWIF